MRVPIYFLCWWPIMVSVALKYNCIPFRHHFDCSGFLCTSLFLSFFLHLIPCCSLIDSSYVFIIHTEAWFCNCHLTISTTGNSDIDSGDLADIIHCHRGKSKSWHQKSSLQRYWTVSYLGVCIMGSKDGTYQHNKLFRGHVLSFFGFLTLAKY